METVPFHFCERVSALWRCFDTIPDRRRRRSAIHSFRAAKWNFGETKAIGLFMVTLDGKWKYGFLNPDYAGGVPANVAPEDLMLTAGELRNHRDWKRVRVNRLRIFGHDQHHVSPFQRFVRDLDVQLGNLLKFTSFLTNEPSLYIDSLEYLNSAPDGAVMKKWIESRSYYDIGIHEFGALDQILLEKLNERSKQKQLLFCIYKLQDDQDGDILDFYLMSGKLRKLATSTILFPFEVLDAIIENFRKNPEGYTGSTLEIKASFDHTSPGKLEEMRRKGFCHMERENHFIFEAGGNHISVDFNPESNEYRIADL